MFTLLFLLLGLTIATCVIAYWSDNLGKKLGKKRVTILGLRPRQTATLMTMVSSVGIMLFTFVVLLVTNSSLRNALLRYDEERAANLRLRTANRQLRDDQKTLQNQAKEARQQANTARQQATSYQQEASSVGKQLSTARTQLKNEQAVLKIAQAQEKAARTGEKTAQASARQAGLRLKETQERLRTVDDRLKTAQIRLAGLNKRLANAQAQLGNAQRNARVAQQNAKKAQEYGARASEQARKKGQDFLRQYEEVLRLEKRQQELTTEIAQLTEDKERLALYKTQLATLDTSFLAGWVFDARLIAPRTNSAQIATELRDMVERASREVSETDTKRTLHLLSSIAAETAPPPTADKIIQELAQDLSFSNVPVSVRLTSVRNHAAAETEIEVELVPILGRLVINRGATLDAVDIAGGQSDVKIFGQLYRLLTKSEEVARKRGVNPYVRPEKEEYFYAEDTNERIFEALHRIQKLKAPVQVRLVAAKDISAIDRLSVRFEITPTES